MRRPAAIVACTLSVLLAAAGCGGGSQHNTARQSAGSRSTASASPAQPSNSPQASGHPAALPAVSGSYGSKPHLRFSAGTAPRGLAKKVLLAGHGPVVRKGDLLVADYLGQVWGGKVFDNSYDRHAPAGFPIGVGAVIPGWDKTLVGVRTGSRLLLSIPPKQGYGPQGNPQAGIKGTDTLVFVVDVIRAYGKNAAGDPHAVRESRTGTGPTVTGALTRRPTVTIPKGAAQPKQEVTTVVAKGHGAPVHNGLVVMQYEAVEWSGKPLDSTWQRGTPAGVPIGDGMQPTPFDTLKGIPVGSQVLLQLPGQQGKPAVAVAVDIVAEPETAAKTTHF